MTNGRDWAILSLGLIVGASAALVYWHSSQTHSQFIFEQNQKCQQIAKQFESDNNYRNGVLKVTYSPRRNSCVAEVARSHSDGVDYTIEDLLSGETLFDKRTQTPDILNKEILKEQDAKFAAVTQ
jgi:hypothetical protein